MEHAVAEVSPRPCRERGSAQIPRGRRRGSAGKRHRLVATANQAEQAGAIGQSSVCAIARQLSEQRRDRGLFGPAASRLPRAKRRRGVDNQSGKRWIDAHRGRA